MSLPNLLTKNAPKTSYWVGLNREDFYKAIHANQDRMRRIAVYIQGAYDTGLKERPGSRLPQPTRHQGAE